MIRRWNQVNLERQSDCARASQKTLKVRGKYGDRVFYSAAGAGNRERLVRVSTVYGRFGSVFSSGWAVPNTRNQLVVVPRNFSETTTEVLRSGFKI